MSRLNLPVPAGFVISTEACIEYLGLDKDSPQLEELPDHLINEYSIKIHEIERLTQRIFGNVAKEKGKVKQSSNLPLLLSVRSGAAVSMPGMMETILNLGLNDDVVCEMIRVTNNPRFVYGIVTTITILLLSLLYIKLL